MKINFQTQISLISGIANSGKTSLIQAIALLFNPHFHNSYNLNLKFIKRVENKPTIIEAEINTFSIRSRNIEFSNLSKELKLLLSKKSNDEAQIRIEFNSIKDGFRYFLEDVEIQKTLLKEWLRYINGYLSKEKFSNTFFSLQNYPIFFEGMSSEFLYLILINHLSLSDTIDKFSSLNVKISKLEENLKKQHEILSEGKIRENELSQDVENLNQYNDYKNKLAILENELVWAPVIQTEDRINALSKTLETTISDIKKNENEIKTKDQAREEIVQKTNNIEVEKKKKEQEFELLRNDYLEKKSRIDKFTKEYENYEKSIKRFTFDERQKQMKMTDYKRILKEIDLKKQVLNNNNNSNITEKKKNLQNDIDSLQRELNELKEKKDAYQNEKNIKKNNKKKLESSVNSASSKMQILRNEINKLEDQSISLVKENDQLYSIIDELTSKNVQLGEKQTEIEKELKEIKKNQIKLNKEVSKSTIQRPDQIRAVNTINTLITNLKRSIEELESFNLNLKASKELETHLKWTKEVNTEIQSIMKKKNDLSTELEGWKTEWNTQLTKTTRILQDKINYFLESWKTSLIIDLNFPESPESGFLNVTCDIDGKTCPPQLLSTSSKNLINIIWQLSLSLLSKNGLIVVDEELLKINPSDLIKLFLKINEGIKKEIIESRTQIILTHENFPFQIPYSESFSNIHLVKS